MAICTKCGAQIDDNAAFCPVCGNQENAQQAQYQQPQYQQPQYQQPQYQQPQYQQPQYQYQQPYPYDPNLSTAKTLGIIALVAFFINIPIVPIICGGIGLSKANASLQMNPYFPEMKTAKTLNLVGLILGIVQVIGWIFIFTLFFVGAFASMY